MESSAPPKKPPAVWLVAGGPMQRRAAEAIKRRGYALILTDGNPDCACAPLADAFVRLDTFDIEANRIAAESCRALDGRSAIPAA